jgi:hypothetical protein
VICPGSGSADPVRLDVQNTEGEDRRPMVLTYESSLNLPHAELDHVRPLLAPPSRNRDVRAH